MTVLTQEACCVYSSSPMRTRILVAYFQRTGIELARNYRLVGRHRFRISMIYLNHSKLIMFLMDRYKVWHGAILFFLRMIPKWKIECLFNPETTCMEKCWHCISAWRTVLAFQDGLLWGKGNRGLSKPHIPKMARTG